MSTITDNEAANMPRRIEPVVVEKTFGPMGTATIDFGRRLERAMANKGWSQAETARAASRYLPDKKFRRDSLSLYVRGMQFPSPARLMALCKALGVHESDLVSEALASGPGSPPISIKTLDDGTVWFQANQRIPMDLALKIAMLLKASEKEMAGEK